MKQLLIFLTIFVALISNTAPSKTVKELIKKIKREPEYVSLYDLKAFELVSCQL